MINARGLRMDFIAPDDLPNMCADLLLEAPPGSGEHARVSVERVGEGGSGGIWAAEAITGRPTFRIGHYMLTSTDRRGQRGRQAGLTWVDNDHGRYTLCGEPGRKATMYSPAARRQATDCQPARSSMARLSGEPRYPL